MNFFGSDSRPTILFVNISPGIEEFLRAEWGDRCELVIARNTVEAFVKITEHHPDAIVSDTVLPSLTAVDLMQGLKSLSETCEVPVAVFSRGQDQGVVKTCCDAGASIVVTPRTERARVMSWLEEIIERREESMAPPNLNSDMATSIATATNDVLDAILGVEAECGKLRIEKIQPRRADVIGTVNVAGFVSGGITVFLGMDFATAIARRMLGDGFQEPSDEEIVDAVGELTNMIAGNIKTCLCRTAELFSMSPPSVILGREVRRVRLEDKLAFLLPCSLQGQELLVEFNLSPRRRSNWNRAHAGAGH